MFGRVGDKLELLYALEAPQVGPPSPLLLNTLGLKLLKYRSSTASKSYRSGRHSLGPTDLNIRQVSPPIARVESRESSLVQFLGTRPNPRGHCNAEAGRSPSVTRGMTSCTIICCVRYEGTVEGC